MLITKSAHEIRGVVSLFGNDSIKYAKAKLNIICHASVHKLDVAHVYVRMPYAI